MSKNKEITLWIIAMVSFMSSIIAVCVSCYRTENLGFDYQGVIVGVLSLLVTALLGWQIYTSIAMEARMRKVADDIVTKKADDVKKTIYASLSTTYISLIATAVKANKFFDAILYNECLIDCAIKSKDKNIAKEIIDNAFAFNNEYGNELDKYCNSMLNVNIESIKNRLIPIFPELSPSLISLLYAAEKSP